MRQLRAHSFLILGLILVAHPLLGGNKDEQGAQILSQALQHSDVWTGGRPIQMRATLRVPITNGTDAKLECVAYWAAPDKWRVEWTGAGFAETTVVSNGKLYQTRNSAVPPVQVLAFEEGIGLALGKSPSAPFFSPLGSENPKTGVSKEKINGVASECVSTSSVAGKTCVDPATSRILRYTAEQITYAFDRCNTMDAKEYPSLVRGTTNHGKLLFEASVSLTRPADFPGSLFDPLPQTGASDYADCADLRKNIPVPEVQQVVLPKYPADARNNLEQGTVWLYAAVKADGSTDKVELLGGAAPDLGKAALEAVRHWKYDPPYMRCGKGAPFETLISVNFELRHY